MRILSKEEATKVERSKRDPWIWPEPVNVAISNSGKVLRIIGALSADGEPLSFAFAVNFFETLYAHGYVIAKLDADEVAPTSIDLAQTARLVKNVEGLAEITSGELHTELVNILMSVPTVEVGQVWQGITGNRFVVQEIKDGRARLCYEDDSENEWWKDVEDIRTAFTLVRRQNERGRV